MIQVIVNGKGYTHYLHVHIHIVIRTFFYILQSENVGFFFIYCHLDTSKEIFVGVYEWRAIYIHDSFDVKANNQCRFVES